MESVFLVFMIEFVVMRILKPFLLFFLILPNLAYVLLHKSLFLNDDSQYGRAAVELWIFLVNHPLEWFYKILTIHSFRPPMLYLLGEFFVPIGHVFGSISIGLLVFICTLSFLSLWLMWAILDKLFRNRLICIVGCLAMASSPLFMALSRLFMLEMLQILFVLAVIYLAIVAQGQNKQRLVLMLFLVVSTSFLIKASEFIFCLGPFTLIMVAIFKNKESLFNYSEWARRWALILITYVLFAIMLGWYTVNLESELNYLRHAVKWNDLTIPFNDRVLYWLVSVQDCFFLWPVLIMLACIMLFSLFVRRASSVQVYQLVLVSVFQVLLFVVIQSMSTTGSHRFMFPVLPYFIVLICYSLARIDRAIVTSFVLLVLLSQLVFLSLFSFGLFFKGKNASIFHKTIQSFTVTRAIGPIKYEFQERNLLLLAEMKELRELLNEININSKVVIIDVGVKRSSFLYYAQCEAFPQLLDWQQLFSFADPHMRDIDAGALVEVLTRLQPTYYITNKEGKSKEIVRLLLERGQYKKVVYSNYPTLHLYRNVSKTQ